MARIRSIKPEFFTSETVSQLPLRTRLTWIGLWTHCDNYGRARDNVKLIKAAVWPLDEVSPKDIEIDLSILADCGLIVRYRVASKPYLMVANWAEHQYGAGKGEPKYPGPDAADQDESGSRLNKSGRNPDTHESVPDSSSPNQGSGVRGQDGKLAPPRKPRPPDELFEALISACHIDGSALTESGRGSVNAALKQLRSVDATPNQVKVRAVRYRRRFRDASLTPSALAKHWASLAADDSGSAAAGVVELRPQINTWTPPEDLA